jgi:hypothetical protein
MSEEEMLFQRMINMLNALNQDGSLPDRDDDYILGSTDSEYVEQIEWCADNVLITKDGVGNWEKMDQLYREYGFFVFPGDQDRFGWLTGLIRTKKGLILFG